MTKKTSKAISVALRPELTNTPAYHFKARPYQVKLDQNESPQDLPGPIKQAVLANLSTQVLHRYPEMQAEQLCERLAARYDWHAEGVVVSNGSNVLIQALIIAAGIGQRVLTVSPTFSVYPMQARLLGADLCEVPLADKFSLPKAQLISELGRGSGVLFLANPAAPTGNAFAEADLLPVLEAAQNWLVVIDEAYVQFSQSDARSLLERYDNLLSLRTFSKAYGLAGVRLGFGLCSSALAENLKKVLLPFSLSTLQLITAETVLEHPEYVQDRVTLTLKERARVFKVLQSFAGITPFPSETNFILFKTADAAAIYEALLARGVLIRRQDHLAQLENCLRVTIGLPEENTAFLSALREVLSNREVTA